MTIQELFISSNHELYKVISQIMSEQLKLDMPPGSSKKPLKLKQAINYHTYDDAWVPDVLVGKTISDVGDTYDALLENEDTINNYRTYNLRANEVVSKLKDLTIITHLSYGDFTARDYLQHITSFRIFRAYDFAKLIGIELKLPEDLIDALFDEYSTVVESYRQMGVFGPKIEVSDDVDKQTKLMAMVGRK